MIKLRSGDATDNYTGSGFQKKMSGLKASVQCVGWKSNSLQGEATLTLILSDIFSQKVDFLVLFCSFNVRQNLSYTG